MYSQSANLHQGSNLKEKSFGIPDPDFQINPDPDICRITRKM